MSTTEAFKASLFYPQELLSLVKFKFSSNAISQKLDFIKNPSERKCYDFLFKTSRSFAAVILELDEELRLPICLFYLVLRGLDTVEDDMTIPLDIKLPILRDFHLTIKQKGWTFSGCGPNEKDRALLEEFDVVIEQFLKIKPEYQEIIADITKKMADGMADFAQRRVESLEDWDLYCHYVAGLVGHGLTRLFAASGLEDPAIADDLELANSMGLFLQKVNIIRDYLEDYIDGRCFWPKQIWSKYVDDLGDFTKEENSEKALNCLNELCLNALRHAKDCIVYMSKIKNRSCFNFCAIPQVMAIATISNVYNNPDVFKTNVKIRKGLAVKLIMEATDMNNVLSIFNQFSVNIIKSAKPTDPLFIPYSIWYGQIKIAITQYEEKYSKPVEESNSIFTLATLFAVTTGLIYYHQTA